MNYLLIALLAIFFFSAPASSSNISYKCTSLINNYQRNLSYKQYQKLINSKLKNKIRCKIIFNENFVKN